MYFSFDMMFHLTVSGIYSLFYTQDYTHLYSAGFPHFYSAGFAEYIICKSIYKKRQDFRNSTRHDLSDNIIVNLQYNIVLKNKLY